MGKMTKAEAEALFAEIDADGSGEIRLSELRDYGKDNGGAVGGVKLADFVREADTDGDRRISRSEFTSHFA
ncbi:EF-hand domain-containing protein [Actinacidiphila yeochonensis]|uniref:EF-hand domain-containing protein n=1 Tax=Actinacidiphila yeochonensis TaxID=89050 RepID=UPI00055D0284|nr:EF-hand domain-containing protein [Actinacidiphila yeochonensis]